MGSLLENVKETINKYKMLNDRDKIIVGVSGGPDSLALLHFLHNEYKHIPKAAVHINHNIRGNEGMMDEEFVMEVCEKWEIPCYIFSVDIPKLARELSITIEEAGRIERKRIYKKIMADEGYTKVALGHNLEDRCETILMRFIRGTGSLGLRGILPTGHGIIRPLIETRRKDIEEYCKNNNLEPRMDSTNNETKYTRNKVRHKLIPLIEREYNPKIKDSLIRLSENIIGEREAFLSLIEPKLKSITIDQRQDYITLDLDKLKNESFNLSLYLIKESIIKMGWQDIEKIHMNILEEILLNPRSGNSYNLPRGLKIQVDYNKLIIGRETNKQNTKDYSYILQIPGKLIINGIGTFEARIVSNEKAIDKGNNIYSFDADGFTGSLIIRNRRKGDQFQPFGMDGRKKLKDFLSDIKISKDKRGSIPILVELKDNETILAVMGIRRSSMYPVTDRTKSILLIEYKREDEMGVQ